MITFYHHHYCVSFVTGEHVKLKGTTILELIYEAERGSSGISCSSPTYCRPIQCGQLVGHYCCLSTEEYLVIHWLLFCCILVSQLQWKIKTWNSPWITRVFALLASRWDRCKHNECRDLCSSCVSSYPHNGWWLERRFISIWKNKRWLQLIPGVGSSGVPNMQSNWYKKAVTTSASVLDWVMWYISKFSTIELHLAHRVCLVSCNKSTNHKMEGGESSCRFEWSLLKPYLIFFKDQIFA